MANNPIPIEKINSIDITTLRKDGGVELIVVTDGPLKDTQENRERLLQKINTYLFAIHDPDFIKEFGKPGKDKTSIVIKCEEAPLQGMAKFIEELSHEALKHDATLKWELDENKAQTMPEVLASWSDEAIPLNKIDSIDFMEWLPQGGLNLIVLTAAHLENNKETHERLTLKIKNYLNIIHSSDFIAQHGHPNKDNRVVTIFCVDEPDPKILQLFYELAGMAAQQGASLHWRVFE